MKTYDELKALIIQRGVHAEFGGMGEGQESNAVVEPPKKKRGRPSKKDKPADG